MADTSKHFKATYDYVRAWINDSSAFDAHWQTLVGKLYKLMTEEGFDSGHKAALSDLRKAVKKIPSKGVGGKTVTVDQGILTAVGAWTASATGSIDSSKLMRAAALKFLMHIYLLNQSGNRKVWILSLPDDFHHWPQYDFTNRGTTQAAARTLLKSDNEHFSSDDKKHLAAATRHALAWCQKTIAVLALAGKSGKKSKKADAADVLVERWFGGGTVTATDMATYVANLHLGFKKIIAMLNKGHFVLTDWAPFRSSTAADEIQLRNAEAFTFRNRYEGMDVVYIESNYFTKNPGNVLNGLNNWIRILVHELTHLVCGTEDIVNGQARYAWYGIGPHAGYPGSQAVRNADNWAFFAADCAGALSAPERAKALKIV